LNEFDDTMGWQLTIVLQDRARDLWRKGTNPGLFVVGAFTVAISTNASGLTVSITKNAPGGGMTAQVP
jgi:hypothetical protein